MEMVGLRWMPFIKDIIYNNMILNSEHKENIVLIGGGNQSQYVIDIIEREGLYNIVGIIDSIKEIGELVYRYPVIGRQEDIKLLCRLHNFSLGIVTIGDNYIRYKVACDILKKDPFFRFANAIHPSVIIGNNTRIGLGIVAMAGVIINPGAIIEDFCFFATGAQIEHDCVIEYAASISAGSILGGHVIIKHHASITLGVTIFDRITIGENTVVGSGSLVTKDLPSNVLAYGSPAKIIRTRKLGERFLK